MHDDDLPDDDLRAALERRAGRSTPAGVDALLARSQGTTAADRRGRGAWMAAAAALVLLGGLVGYVASVGEPEPEDVVVPADNGAPEGPRGADDVEAPPGWPVTLTVGDLRDQLLATDLLVLNGTWGLFAETVPGQLVAAMQGYGDGSPVLGTPRVEAAGGAPISTSFVYWQPPATRELATLVGAEIGIDRVVRGRVAVDRFGIDIATENLVILIGADLDTQGASCPERFDPEGCAPSVKWREEPWSERTFDEPSILHPPVEVRVLVLNGTTTVGAAGQLADELRANRGYDSLPPGNAIELAAISAVYYTPTYELDARQIAQILNAVPESVRPLPDGVLPAETDGDPHVVIVVGDDLVG